MSEFITFSGGKPMISFSLMALKGTIVNQKRSLIENTSDKQIYQVLTKTYFKPKLEIRAFKLKVLNNDTSILRRVLNSLCKIWIAEKWEDRCDLTRQFNFLTGTAILCSENYAANIRNGSTLKLDNTVSFLFFFVCSRYNDFSDKKQLVLVSGEKNRLWLKI